MRLLFYEDVPKGTFTDDYFKVKRVDLSDTLPDSARDMWLRVKKEIGGYPVLGVWSDRGRASADELAEDYMAATGNITETGIVTVTLINNAEIPPDLTGLRVECEITATDGLYNAVWGYLDSPALELIQRIEQILEEYTGAGMALAEFTVGQIRRGDPEQRSRHRRIIVSLDEDRETEDQHRDHGLSCGFVIEIGVLDAAESGFKAFRLSSQYAGAVRSILHDERLTLGGIATQTKIHSISAPEQRDESSGAYYVVTMRGSALFTGKVHTGT